MRYLQRDPDGKVIGHYAHPHDYAQEAVADDHPEILAWHAKRVADKAAYMARKADLSPEKLLARIAELEAKLKARGNG